MGAPEREPMGGLRPRKPRPGAGATDLPVRECRVRFGGRGGLLLDARTAPERSLRARVHDRVALAAGACHEDDARVLAGADERVPGAGRAVDEVPCAAAVPAPRSAAGRCPRARGSPPAWTRRGTSRSVCRARAGQREASLREELRIDAGSLSEHARRALEHAAAAERVVRTHAASAALTTNQPCVTGASPEPTSSSCASSIAMALLHGGLSRMMPSAASAASHGERAPSLARLLRLLRTTCDSRDRGSQDVLLLLPWRGAEASECGDELGNTPRLERLRQ
jgi:hypothetical protein